MLDFKQISIYNYTRPLNYFLFLDFTLLKNNRLYIIHKFQTDIQKMVIKQFPIFLHYYVKNFCEIKSNNAFYTNKNLSEKQYHNNMS